MTTDIAKPMTPMEAFQAKLKDKIRDDIASMLPDEAVAEMAARVVNEEFFTKTRRNVGSSYSPDWREEPSPFQRMVLEAAKPIVEAEVKKALQENNQRVLESFDQTVKAGLLKLMLESFEQKIEQAITNNGYAIKNALEQIGR
jgi:hypothetical protein